MREPEMPVIVPDHISRSQVCHDCFQYLSVGPVIKNAKKDLLCGRWGCNAEETGLQTKSLYNVLAQGIKFKCTNHINGCKEVLFPALMEDHENYCPYKPQDCFFCSFSGNLSQIVNHSSLSHPENITFDGQFVFSLINIDSKKSLLYYLDDNLYLINIEITEEVVKIYIELQNRKVTSNHFAIKFFNSLNPSDSGFMLTEYGMLHDKFPSCIEKSMEHLIISFGSGASLRCQILVDGLKLTDKEVEIQNRYEILRKGEEKLAQLQSKAGSYNAATNLIKIMSHTFFKCISCQKARTVDMYFCENMHVYCRNCLTSICKGCGTTMEYKNLKEFEDFVVPCDYADCNKVVKISQYLAHNLNCLKRPYKCPLKSCNEVVLSADGLIQHWHSEIPKLFLNETIELETYKTEEFYWLIKSDLYRVLINFTRENINVLIDEIDALNTDKIAFKCEGYYSSQWHNIPMSLFCGKSHFNMLNKYNTSHYGCVGLTRLRIMAPL